MSSSIRKFKHLEINEPVYFDWKTNLLKKTLSKRCFNNPITKDFILLCERILGITYEQIENVEKYHRIWRG